MGAERLENAAPTIYAVKARERPMTGKELDESVEDPIDSWEIFDLIRDINDPEHPYSLEQLNVVQEELITVHRDQKETFVDVSFTPTIPHCSMATLIGLAIRVKLQRSLHSKVKIRVAITPGSHSTEEAINRQLADKERVAAAMENQGLMQAMFFKSNFFVIAGLRNFSTKKGNVKKYLQRQYKDEFAVRAREHNYRARSAFKLMEIDDRFQILRPGLVVLDVGCAPGSWLQVVSERCLLNSPAEKEGYLLGIDLQLVLPVPGADILSFCDVTSVSTQKKLQAKLRGRLVDVVLSDMAPNPTGDSGTDHLRLVNLNRTVFHLFNSSENVFQLSRDGVFVCKMWDGEVRSDFIKELSFKFKSVKIVKPAACRDNSAEINKMPWRHAVKVAMAAGEAVAKALTRAVREEIKQSQHAAARHATSTGQSASETRQSANTNAKLGITLEESLQILNVKTPLDAEEVQKNYDHLFAINDKSKGGSFYLQSKIYRAKERIDEEMERIANVSNSTGDKKVEDNQK
ncbi:unnamed protein product [Caenorhabditis auriculariae]|uniref:Mitochondrial import inner membrane translocase subunit tim-16 n=1 Tax=Caenorhabditis auriculariae TaxID=2777116 RepID=A0A8S1HRA1_9PELO|nr:unnamed protein product [Caenorhabditis auriculariae]